MTKKIPIQFSNFPMFKTQEKSNNNIPNRYFFVLGCSTAKDIEDTTIPDNMNVRTTIKKTSPDEYRDSFIRFIKI